MGTRGFVGYKYDGEIKGWYNHFDSYYGYLGIDVLNAYEQYSNAEKKDFFLNQLILVEDDPEDNYYQNHKEVFKLDWTNDTTVLQDGSEFLYDGLFCEYGYVFNLDNDTVEVYRGFFKEPQYEGQPEVGGYYTHRVLVIDDYNSDDVRNMFHRENDARGTAEDNEYWEMEFLG